jgi:hypothetical protein
VLIGFTGSILGLSLINSIFVDQMLAAEQAADAAQQQSIEAMREELREVKALNTRILAALKRLEQNLPEE